VDEPGDVAARTRQLDAVEAGHQLDDDGLVRFAFDPRRGDYDPMADLDQLGVDYDVQVVEGKAGAWFEVRFRPGRLRGVQH
jgi:hypothetical protein